jgi:hypothetical protein
MEPGFTVVIPLHDAAPFIRRTLERVAAQTEPPARTIVVDDGSTDGGAELVAREFPWVTLVTQANQGVASARNRGIAAAATDWVAFLDADDYWHPDHLRELAATIERVPEARLVSTAYRTWSPGQPEPRPRPARSRTAIRYFLEASRDVGLVCSSTAAAHRETLQAVGGFPEHRRGEDLACWAAIALDHPVARSDAETAVYVRHGAGAMSVVDPAPSGGSRPVLAPTYEELSPSAALVARALASGRHRACTDAELSLYLDSRVNAAVRASLVARDRRSAAAYRRLRTRPFRARFWVLHLAERVPQPVLDLARRSVGR